MTDEFLADDFGASESAAPSSITPLSEILSEPKTDSPDVRQSVSTEGESRPRDESAWLEREISRRTKADERAEKLRAQLDKYESAKYGLHDDEPGQSFGQSDYQPESGEPGTSQTRDGETFALDYNQSFTKFATKHGREYTATVDAALRHLTPGQTDEMKALAGTAADPVEAVHGYIKKLGLLEHKPQSLADVLAGKEREKTADGFVDQRIDPRIALDQREQAIAAAEGRVKFVASKTDFISEHGKAAFNDLDQAYSRFIASGHPAVAEFVATCSAQPDPITAAAHVLSQWGLWAPDQQREQPKPQPKAIFPSNIAAARNVGVRNGPAWPGPESLNDIFDRRNKAS